MQFVVKHGPYLVDSFPISGYPIGGGPIPNPSYVVSGVPFPRFTSSPWGLPSQLFAYVGGNI